MSSARLVLAALVALSVSASLPKLTVEYPSADHSAFTIAVDGVDWFKNGQVMVTRGNAIYHSGSNLTQLTTDAVSGKGPWGPYEGSQVSWTTDSSSKVVDFTTTVKLYSSAGVATFTQSFPQGLEGCSFGSKNGVSSGFPVFKPESLKSSNQPERLWMAYNGE
jgi:hypothetical protein